MSHPMYSSSEEEVFDYLDALRESGITNVFGASPYVQREFGLPRAEANALLSKWMHTFGIRHPKET